MPRGVMVQVTNAEPSWEYVFTVTNTTDETTADITQSFAKTSRPLMYIENMPDGTPLTIDSDGYTFSVTVSNISGSATSAVTSPRALQLNDSSTIDELAVEKLVAGDLLGAFALLGALQVGAGITITPENGIRIETPLGATVLPADGKAPKFTGTATFDALTVLGNLGIRGRTNEVTKGSRLELATGTTPPSTGPEISSFYPSRTMHGGYSPRGLAYHNASGLFYRTESLFSAQVTATDSAGAYALKTVNVSGSDDSGGGGAWNRTEVQSALGGVAINGNDMYVLCQTDEEVPGTYDSRWYVYRGTWNGTKWNYAGRWLYEPNTSLGGYSNSHPAIGIRPSNGHVVIVQCGNGGTLNYTHYTSTGSYVDRGPMHDVDGNRFKPARATRAAFYSTADTGVERLYVLLVADDTIHAFQPDWDYRDWPPDTFPSTGNIGSLMWDATRSIFRGATLSSDGSADTLYDFSTIRYQTLAAVQTWRLRNETSPRFAAAETLPSVPTETSSFPKRASLRLSAPPIPDDSNDPADPDSVSFYVATTLGGANSTYKLQTVPAAGVREVVYSNVGTSGVAPPTASGFTDEVPASITSDKGDGNGEFLQLYGNGANQRMNGLYGTADSTEHRKGSIKKDVVWTEKLQVGRGTAVISSANVTYEQWVDFPVPFPAGSTVVVVPSIRDLGHNTAAARVSARGETNVGFYLQANRSAGSANFDFSYIASVQ